MTRVLARRGEKRCREAQTLPVSQSVSQSVSVYTEKNKQTLFLFVFVVVSNEMDLHPLP